MFPLPLLEEECLERVVGGRASRRRHGRERLVRELVDDAVLALNWMNGYKDKVVVEKVTDKHRELHERLWRLASRHVAAAPANLPNVAAAACELLRGSPGYTDTADQGNLASYKEGSVSLPEDVFGCPSLLEVGDAECRRCLEEKHERMLRDPEEMREVCFPRVVMDPVLERNPRAYVKFVRMLKDKGLLRFARDVREKVWGLLREEI